MANCLFRYGASFSFHVTTLSKSGVTCLNVLMHIEKVDGIAATLVTISIHHSGKCKSNRGYYNELVLA